LSEALVATAIKFLSPKDKTATALVLHPALTVWGIAMPSAGGRANARRHLPKRPPMTDYKDAQPHNSATSTRRAILAGAVAIPALRIPAIATGLDPAFPAIERAREANAAVQTLGLCDDDEINAVCDVWRNAHRAAFRTGPTTAAGAIALIGYAIEFVCTHGHGGALAGDDPIWELVGDGSKPAGNSTVDLFQSLSEFLR
jgi:hypothetical protein